MTSKEILKTKLPMSYEFHLDGKCIAGTKVVGVSSIHKILF